MPLLRAGVCALLSVPGLRPLAVANKCLLVYMGKEQGGKAPASESRYVAGRTPGFAVAVAVAVGVLGEAGCLTVIVVYNFGRSKFCQEENCEQ